MKEPALDPETTHDTPAAACFGFTIVELLVVCGIIAVLASLLLAVFGKSKDMSKKAVCLNNLRQLTVADLAYASENTDGLFCPERYAIFPIFDQDFLWWYMGVPAVPKSFFCPCTIQGENLRMHKDTIGNGKLYCLELMLPARNRFATNGHSYDIIPFFSDMENYWNGNSDFKDNSQVTPKTLSSVNAYRHEHEAFDLAGKVTGASQVWLFSDVDSMIANKSFYPDQDNNHGIDGMNVAFCDGHVEWIKRDEVVYRHELSQDNNRTQAYPR